jgi:hypothetical protein
LSNILTQPITQAEPLEAAARVERRSWRRWPKLILLLLVSLWIANESVSLLIQHTALNRKITARLGAAFGRSVEVGGYRVSLWGRPTLEARSVVVGEDSRFGREYFLRAEALTMSVRWLSLVRGRLEFGTISLSHPSLNLVRNPDGDWNLAEWLPRLSVAPQPGAGSAASPQASSPAFHAGGASTALRFSRINVDLGRINFKRGDEKLPFAFVGVTGYVEPAGPGQWQMDLEAVPTRAAVVVQHAGMLHLWGHVGGTSSRLRPAAVDLAWTDASIPDVLRLIRGTDYGIRGNLALVLNARTEAEDWLLEGRAEIRQVHRWDLPLRPDNPSLNLIAKGSLDPERARFDLDDSTFETSRSNARANGVLSWAHPSSNQPTGASAASSPTLQIVSKGIDISDVLAWVRAFHAGVSDDLALRGNANLDITVGGWPPRIADAALSTNGAALTGKTLPVPVTLNLPSLRYGPKGAFLPPATVAFGAAGGALHVEMIGLLGATTPTKVASTRPPPTLHVAGSLVDAGNLISAVRLLGWDISRGWDLKGPVRGDLKWQASPYPWRASPVGTLDFGGEIRSDAPNVVGARGAGELEGRSGGDILRAPFLNLPIERIRAHVELKPNARHIALTSAEAFGAHWTGTFDRRETIPDLSDSWHFALSADRLVAADLDRWLNPHWRESFLDRVLPFFNSRPSVPAQPENLVASGKLTIDQFMLAPVLVHHMQSDATIEGRRLSLSNIHAQVSKGEITGTLRADLEATPSYRMNLDFSDIDLYAFTAAAPSLADRFAGSASGKIAMAARGAAHADLISSLQCRGVARITAAELASIDLTDSFADGAFRPGKTTFREASAGFTCAASKINFLHLLLSGSSTDLSAEGTIDFNRNLDLKLTVLPASVTPRPTPTSEQRSDSYHLSGTLSEPEVTRLKSPTRP